jgi:hypothetical protein
MPDLDGTGPLGKGPLTGRKRGHCRDMQTERADNQSTGYGLGFRKGNRKGNQGRGS